MGKATQVMAAGRRFAVWLLPAGRRDWAAAVWAEAHEVPPGLARLSWRAGGAWVLAREALLPRRRSTLAIGAGTGLLFGVVMFAVDPFGLNKWATNPWLPGSTADPLVALAWMLLFGGPVAAAVLAGRQCRGPDGARPPYNVRFGQGIAAGVTATGIAAMFTTVLGTGTTLLMLRSPWLLHWVNHGRHLTAFATYRYEINTANAAGGYVLMLLTFPVVGLFMSSLAAAIANPAPGLSSSPPGHGGGPPGPGPGPEPEAEPPGGGRAE